MSTSRLLLVALLCLFGLSAGAAERPVLRLGLLKFGTVSWEVATMTAHGLDRAAGVDLVLVDLANPQAGRIALLGGSVDMIAGDWLWVSRQRAAGHAITFLPYSSAVGGLMVADPAIASVGDLKGRRIGVAGGPLDKSWLLLRALARDVHGLDLEAEAEIVHAAPPLLNQKAQAGDLDAVLTYWHFAARLQAKGFRSLVDADAAASALGVGGAAPWLGYVVTDAWAEAHPDALAGFYDASRQARALLTEDAAWEPLRGLMRAGDAATFAALRDGYRAGAPPPWDAGQEAAAAKLFALLRAIGGRDLVGPATGLTPGTFSGVLR